MAYHEGSVVHDADSHVMETPDWLDEFAPARIQTYLREHFSIGDAEAEFAEIKRCREMHASADYREKDAAEIMLRKNWRATGSFLAADRSGALDHLGFASQLVFPTVLNVMLENVEHQGDDDLTYEIASSGNRALQAFCSTDPRLLSTAYVPLANIERAAKVAEEAIAQGARGLLIPYRCPRDHATSHVGFDAVWARAQEARVPVLLHVATPELVMPSQHRNNGLPPEPDFHGGGENFRSVSYMAISSTPMQALSMLIFDGVLERFPELRIGVIELGAVWVPGFLRQLESAFEAFARHERRLSSLSLRPSEYFKRQVRVTPYPTEPTGWIIEQSGPEICMFSSDYPHVEGGRNPMRRFANEVEPLSDETRERFYRGNFEDLMGSLV